LALCHKPNRLDASTNLHSEQVQLALSHKDETEKFVDYFRRHLHSIAALPVECVSTPLYQKILYVTVLDALSKSVYPRSGNRTRMVSFLRKFSEWQDAEKVSLTHLVQLLKRVPDPAFEELRTFAVETFEKWPVHKGEIVTLDVDPTFETVRSKWPVEKEHRVPIENVSLESLQHVRLFYTYRNSLVHELREPSFGMDLSQRHKPHYHLVSDLTTYDTVGLKTVALVYPVTFFRTLCDNGLSNLAAYLERNDLNPYDYYVVGDYWIHELNI